MPPITFNNVANVDTFGFARGLSAANRQIQTGFNQTRKNLTGLATDQADDNLLKQLEKIRATKQGDLRGAIDSGVFNVSNLPGNIDATAVLKAAEGEIINRQDREDSSLARSDAARNRTFVDNKFEQERVKLEQQPFIDQFGAKILGATTPESIAALTNEVTNNSNLTDANRISILRKIESEGRSDATNLLTDQANQRAETSRINNQSANDALSTALSGRANSNEQSNTAILANIVNNTEGATIDSNTGELVLDSNKFTPQQEQDFRIELNKNFINNNSNQKFINDFKATEQFKALSLEGQNKFIETINTSLSNADDLTDNQRVRKSSFVAEGSFDIEQKVKSAKQNLSAFSLTGGVNSTTDVNSANGLEIISTAISELRNSGVVIDTDVMDIIVNGITGRLSTNPLKNEDGSNIVDVAGNNITPTAEQISIALKLASETESDTFFLNPFDDPNLRKERFDSILAKVVVASNDSNANRATRTAELNDLLQNAERDAIGAREKLRIEANNKFSNTGRGSNIRRNVNTLKANQRIQLEKQQAATKTQRAQTIKNKKIIDTFDKVRNGKIIPIKTSNSNEQNKEIITQNINKVANNISEEKLKSFFVLRGRGDDLVANRKLRQTVIDILGDSGISKSAIKGNNIIFDSKEFKSRVDNFTKITRKRFDDIQNKKANKLSKNRTTQRSAI